MQLSNIIAVAFLFAGSAFANPVAGKPTHPEKPQHTTVSQTNSCGNDQTPYCCNTDNKGKYTVCKALDLGLTCSATTVCCNNNGSGTQVCLGNAIIEH